MSIGIGGLIGLVILLILGFFLGFTAGISYVFQKIKIVCGNEMYKSLIDELHEDINK